MNLMRMRYDRSLQFALHVCDIKQWWPGHVSVYRVNLHDLAVILFW